MERWDFAFFKNACWPGLVCSGFFYGMGPPSHSAKAHIKRSSWVTFLLFHFYFIILSFSFRTDLGTQWNNAPGRYIYPHSRPFFSGRIKNIIAESSRGWQSQAKLIQIPQKWSILNKKILILNVPRRSVCAKFFCAKPGESFAIRRWVEIPLWLRWEECLWVCAAIESNWSKEEENESIAAAAEKGMAVRPYHRHRIRSENIL